MADFQLPPQYAPREVERRLYRRWVDRGAFAPSPDPRREPYVIVIPPPNVTAVLHMGQGLNNVTQDVLIRFERMRGRAALWLPGTDHAGIATQNVVERIIASEVGRRVVQVVLWCGGTWLSAPSHSVFTFSFYFHRLTRRLAHASLLLFR